MRLSTISITLLSEMVNIQFQWCQTLKGKMNLKERYFIFTPFKHFTKEEFEDKNILLVGCSYSGCDIVEMLYITNVTKILPKKIKLLVRPKYL